MNVGLGASEGGGEGGGGEAGGAKATATFVMEFQGISGRCTETLPKTAPHLLPHTLTANFAADAAPQVRRKFHTATLRELGPARPKP